MPRDENPAALPSTHKALRRQADAALVNACISAACASGSNLLPEAGCDVQRHTTGSSISASCGPRAGSSARRANRPMAYQESKGSGLAFCVKETSSRGVPFHIPHAGSPEAPRRRYASTQKSSRRESTFLPDSRRPRSAHARPSSGRQFLTHSSAILIE